MSAPLHYGVSTGEALHMIPAFGHEISEEDDLTVHGREDHHYGPDDWDLVMWADSSAALLEMTTRVRLSRRLAE